MTITASGSTDATMEPPTTTTTLGKRAPAAKRTAQNTRHLRLTVTGHTARKKTKNANSGRITAKRIT
ncbi:unknown [Sutterella sp. CAG:397]|nr:unknown [Sutterella sp. CAG:397]